MPFGLDKVFDLVNKVPSPWNTVIWLFVGAISTIVLIMKAVGTVSADERSNKTRLGRLVMGKNGEPKDYGPGAHLLIPLFDKLVQQNTLIRTITLDEMKVKYGCYDLDIIHSRISLVVVSVWRVRYYAKDLDEQIKGICTRHLPDCIYRSQYRVIDEAATREIERLFMQSAAYDELKRLGLRLYGWMPTSVAPDAQLASAGAQYAIATAISENGSSPALGQLLAAESHVTTNGNGAS